MEGLEMSIHKSVGRGMVYAAPLAGLLWAVIIILAFVVTGCAAKPVPVRTITQTVEVQVPAPCPVAAELARLKAARPVPLDRTPPPPTIAERIAKSLAQLGLYEAPGGYADQVDAALDRCAR